MREASLKQCSDEHGAFLWLDNVSQHTIFTSDFVLVKVFGNRSVPTWSKGRQKLDFVLTCSRICHFAQFGTNGTATSPLQGARKMFQQRCQLKQILQHNCFPSLFIITLLILKTQNKENNRGNLSVLSQHFNKRACPLVDALVQWRLSL